MSNLFSSQQKKGGSQDGTSAEEMSNMLKDIMRRLRQMEERYSNLRKSMQVTEQNMLKQSKKNTSDKQDLQSDIAELKKHIRNIGEELKIVAKELGNSAKKDDVKVLEKYINFLDPLTYVTKNEFRKEVKRVIKEELENKE